MGLFGPPDVEKAKARGQVEDLLRAAKYKKDPAVAAAGREALAEHIDLLVRELHTKNIRRLKIAREALVVIGPPARDRLIFVLDNGHAHWRQDAAFVLGEMGDAQAVEPLCNALRHPNALLRALAAQALGKIGSPDAIRSLRLACGDDDSQVAKEARKALGKIPGGKPAAGG